MDPGDKRRDDGVYPLAAGTIVRPPVRDAPHLEH
jgi:hypothetical protein